MGIVLAAGPLSITNVDSPDPVATGSQITYTIVVTNTGGAKVDNVVLTDQFNGLVGFGNPPLLDAVSTRGNCTQNNTQVTCSAGSIEGRGTWTVTIRGIVSAAGGTTINNNATVTGTKSAQTYTSSASATTQVTGTQPGGQSPDLTIAKNGPLSAAAGGPLTYTLTVNNTGTATATGIKVTDTLPTGYVIGTVSATSLFTCGVAGQTVTCTGGQVNAGASGTITINGTAPAVASTLTNTAVVDPDDTIDEGVLGDSQDLAERNNTSNTVTTEVSPTPPPPAGPITIAKTRIDAPGGAPVAGGEGVPGQLLYYRVTITNGTLGRADYLTMTDTTQGLQAASLTVLSAVSSGGTTPACTVSAPLATCTMTRLPVNGTMVVEIRGMVVAPAGSTILNNATVTANIKNKGYSATDQVQTIIKPGFDLTITKADTPDPVCASSFPPATGDCTGGLRYDFVLGNSGLSPADDVVVRDPLPPGTSFDAAASSPECSEAGGVVTCIIDVGAESTTAFHIVLVAPASTGTITNTVTVDPGNAVFESDETNNIATQATTVATGIDLTVAKTDAPPGFDPIATSGTQTYTITVDNKGTQDAFDIRVRDTLPAGTIFLSATADNDFTCIHDNSPTAGGVDCTGGDIRGTNWETYQGNGPDSATIVIKVFARPTVGTMINEVRVDPLGAIAEYDETNNVTTETTVVTNGDSTIGAFNELSISKSSSPMDTVATSTPVTYTIIVTNSGTDPAVNVHVRDTLPVGFTLISAADSAPGPLAFLCVSMAGNVVDCNGATIAGGGGSRTLTIVAFSSAVPGSYLNQAIVDPTNVIPEGNETNNAATDGITVNVGAGYIDLTVDKCDAPAGGNPCDTESNQVTPGSDITYWLRVQNLGTNPAFNVVVRDVMPSGTTFVSAQDMTGGSGAFTCVANGGFIDCSGAAIDGTPGDPVPGLPTARDIKIVLRAPLTDNTVLVNQAFVDPGNTIPESNEINNTDVESTTVESRVNLTVDKTGPTSATQSQAATYDITITNEGEDPALGVVMVDPLPVGMIPLTAYTDDPGQNNFSCQVEQNPVNRVTCVGDLDGSDDDLSTLTETVVIHVEVFITATDGTTLDNEACVDPDDVIVEDNELDNCSTASTVVGIPDLAISKSASANVVSNGQTFDYTLVVSNQGDAQTPGAVTVTDDLPSGVSFVSYSATNEFACTHSAGTVTCTDSAGNAPGLLPAESATITITVTVTTSSGPIENTAAVTQVAGENETDNNTDTISTSVGTVGIDLVLTNLGDQPDPVAEGNIVTYRYSVTNAGTAPSGTFDITQEFDDLTGTTPVSATASQGFSCTGPSPLTVTCTGALPAGQTTTVTVVLQTTSASPATLESTITADAGGTVTETNESNNETTETTTVSDAICQNCIDLSVAPILESDDPIDDGDTVTYTVAVGNVGDLSTNTTGSPDVDVQILILGDIEALSDPGSFSETNGFDCSISLEILGAGVIVDCVGELDPGEGTILTVSVVAASAGQTITADASASLTGVDVDPSNNTAATVDTTVNP
jgi:uncharacterized repeat protein (TIGR01451 family)